MDRKTKEALVFAGVAITVGVVAGCIAHDRKASTPKGRIRSGRDSLADFVERSADSFSRRVDQGRDRFESISDRITLSDFLDRLADTLPRKEAEGLLDRIQSRLRKLR